MPVLFSAIIPAILYFWCIFVQIDAYARRNDLKGMPEDQIPFIRENIERGLALYFCVCADVLFLVTLRIEAWAPYFTSLALILCQHLEPKQD